MNTNHHKYKNIKAVFFDVGNTLLFFNLKEVQRALREKGHRVPVEKLRYAEAKAKEIVDHLVLTKSDVLNDRRRAILYYKSILGYLDGIPDKDITHIAKKLRKKDKEVGLWMVMEKNAKKVLHELKKRKYRLGVISNSDGRVEQLLDELKLTPYFEIIVDSAKFGMEKPAPEIFRHAASSLGVKPEHSIYIGDFYSIDVLGARGVGMKPLLIKPFPYYKHPRCATIKSLSELLSLLPSAGTHKT